MSKVLQRRVEKVESREAERGFRHLTDEEIESRIASLAREILCATTIDQLRDEYAGKHECLAVFEVAELERDRHATH